MSLFLNCAYHTAIYLQSCHRPVLGKNHATWTELAVLCIVYLIFSFLNILNLWDQGQLALFLDVAWQTVSDTEDVLILKYLPGWREVTWDEASTVSPHQQPAEAA